MVTSESEHALVDVLTLLTDDGLSTCCNIIYTIMSIFNAMQPVGLKVTGLRCWTYGWPFLCRDSGFSELFNDTIVDIEIPKFITIVQCEMQLHICNIKYILHTLENNM